MEVRIDAGAGLPAEGYTLTAGAGGVAIVGADPAGAFYGAQTHARRHLGVVGEEVQQVVGVMQVVQPDALAFLGTGVGIGPGRPVEHAEGERAERVAVALCRSGGWAPGRRAARRAARRPAPASA
ncbi:glycoside hydrolase family 20 zincin-like fold domain-containing protein [Nonomuraea cypriaca]|uniref:glycoside hydrolase family 20 zincin-like fold domain-containing protein n=1 Tax=Nonomuraea cypriaca TaxID=1187855 RepID=UPI002E290CB9|nr:glycoside hydrolase family 20 zincin-like fold domain-containing protein [Nonomuraea cypriaca]